MDLLGALKFVQGSVAKKELQEDLTHFRIVDGFVRGYNGVMALCSPIGLGVDCTPKAEPMIKAISACEDAVQMTVLSNGKLNIRSGGFKVSIDTIEGETVHVEPEGVVYDIHGEAFINGLKTVLPFMSDDASRPWSCGVLVKDGSMYATNNASMIQFWFGSTFPVVCAIPRMAVKELLRVKKIPTHIQATENSMTFHYEDGCWLRTQLIESKWPNLENIMEKSSEGAKPYPLEPSIFDALEKIKPFAERDVKVYIENATCRTHLTEADGASAMFKEYQTVGVYNIDLLLQLKGLATQWDASRYNTPDYRGLASPIVFYGEALRGVIVGFRL